MDNVQALLRAVCDNPTDDTPRLVLADALDERGREGDAERAEFIREQIAWHRMPHRCHTTPGTLCTGHHPWCDSCQIAKRQEEIATETVLFRDGSRRFRWETWLPPDAILFGLDRTSFERGFVSHATVQPRWWFQHADLVCLRPDPGTRYEQWMSAIGFGNTMAARRPDTEFLQPLERVSLFYPPVITRSTTYSVPEARVRRFYKFSEDPRGRVADGDDVDQKIEMIRRKYPEQAARIGDDLIVLATLSAMWPEIWFSTTRHLTILSTPTRDGPDRNDNDHSYVWTGEAVTLPPYTLSLAHPPRPLGDQT